MAAETTSSAKSVPADQTVRFFRTVSHAVRASARAACAFALLAFAIPDAFAEKMVVDGVEYVCEDGVCRPADAGPLGGLLPVGATSSSPQQGTPRPARMALGYTSEADFVAFLDGSAAADPFAGRSLWAILLLTLLGGLLMNLTPCVLPMAPVNLMVIGRSAARGVFYGLGIALAYGALGVAAALGGLAFGTLQASPWFNLAVAVLFLLLALALAGVFFIDLSKPRNAFAAKRASMLPWLFVFFMGLVSAVLAGACVAPVLISVLLLTGKLYAEGHSAAVGLPFVLGLGMALPWPLLGAGLRVLPKPGAWMKWVNRIFALFVFVLAAHYLHLAAQGFFAAPTSPVEATSPSSRAAGPHPVGATSPSPRAVETAVVEADVATFDLAALSSLSSSDPRPVLVDCWASWCKNCTAMERLMRTSPRIRAALRRYRVIRLRAEDLNALRRLPGFEDVRGLPAFLVYE